MWIRSQDKELLIKANNMLFVREIVNAGYAIAYDLYNNDEFINLGVYNSEERAIEVLDDIQSFVENNYVSVDDMPSHDNSVYPSYYPRCFTMTRKKVFKMPEE